MLCCARGTTSLELFHLHLDIARVQSFFVAEAIYITGCHWYIVKTNPWPQYYTCSVLSLVTSAVVTHLIITTHNNYLYATVTALPL